MSMIFLIGMPGSGKSHWAEQLAAAHSLSFLDLDKLIEEREGQTISGIFKTKGEDYFRHLESVLLREIINSEAQNIIIACGGGVPCFANNLSNMKLAGNIIYLRATPAWLTARLQSEAAHRPLLQEKDLLPYLQQLLNMRKHFYEQADHILDVENISLSTFDKIISSCINRP